MVDILRQYRKHPYLDCLLNVNMCTSSRGHPQIIRFQLKKNYGNSVYVQCNSSKMMRYSSSSTFSIVRPCKSRIFMQGRWTLTLTLQVKQKLLARIVLIFFISLKREVLLPSNIYTRSSLALWSRKNLRPFYVAALNRLAVRHLEILLCLMTLTWTIQWLYSACYNRAHVSKIQNWNWNKIVTKFAYF